MCSDAHSITLSYIMWIFITLNLTFHLFVVHYVYLVHEFCVQLKCLDCLYLYLIAKVDEHILYC